MPIVFRCSHCGKKLSITRKKAGQEVSCPECVHRIKVPVPKELEASLQEVMEEVDTGGVEIDHGNIPAPSEAEIKAEWGVKKNPWIEEEEDEEDFSLGPADLEESGLDMTPMVDVTFLLLIFFMITASFSMQKSMETAPPEPDQDGVSQSVSMDELEEESVVVEIDDQNNIRVDDVPVSGTGELTDVLVAKISNEGKTEMLIEAHPSAKHGLVVAVTDSGITAQMQRIRRSVKKSDD